MTVVELQNRISELEQELGILRASEDCYRRIVETTTEGVWLLDEQGLTSFVNGPMARLLGYGREEMLGRTAISFMAERTRALGEEKLARRRGGVAETYENLYCRKDGSEVWLLVKTNPIFDGQDCYTGALAMVTDVTERRRAEAAKNQLAAIVASAEVAIMSSDMHGRVTSWNRGAENLYGYTAQDMLGNSLSVLALNGEPDLTLSLIGRLELGGALDHVVVRRQRKDGQLVDVSLSLAAIHDDSGAVVGASAIGLDVTEACAAEERLRQAESQLRQAQKMEAIGSLAGGIAHDFNNLLSIILTYTKLLIEPLRPGDPMLADLARIDGAGERAARLTKQLLAFSRQQILEPQVLDLNEVVGGMEEMLGSLLGKQISLSLLGNQECGQTFADRGQVEQVLMSLIVNARDAMPNGGQVTIETQNVELDAAYAETNHGVKPGRYVMMAVSDTGVGMDAKTRARIFDPFFTTKEKGRGTGLGLSTVYGIVSQSQGHVGVSSEPQAGTTFKVYFPRTERQAAVLPANAAPTTLKGKETILVVEDEEGVRSSVRAILRRLGYRVLEASNGDEGLLVCEQYADSLHLLLTDVVMPGMNGRELAQRASKLRPETKVLFMSGYSENTIGRHGVLDPGVTYLSKPLTPDALARKVREVLDAPAVSLDRLDLSGSR